MRGYGDEVEDLRTMFDAAWDEQIQRVYAEQEVFQSQVRRPKMFQTQRTVLTQTTFGLGSSQASYADLNVYQPQVRSTKGVLELWVQQDVFHSQVRRSKGVSEPDTQSRSRVRTRCQSQVCSTRLPESSACNSRCYETRYTVH